MELLSNEVMSALSDMVVVVDMNDHSEDLGKLVKNNWRQEARSRRERSYETVRMHTARGYGAEMALIKTGLFHPVSDVVDDADKLSYEKRKKNVTSCGFDFDVKTMTHDLDAWYVSTGSVESILRSIILNDYFLVMSCRDLGSLKYVYKPKILLDAKKFSEHLVGSKIKHAEFKFDHDSARKKGNCVTW